MLEIFLAITSFILAGSLAYFLHLFKRDRSELHAIRAIQTQQSQALQHLLQDSPLAVITCDEEGWLREPTPSFLNLFKVSKSELVEKKLWDFVESESLLAAKELLRVAHKEKKNCRDVLLVRNSLCEQIWAQVNIIPMKSDFLVAILNISSSVKNQELLERFQQGLDQIQILSVTDRNGIITYVNDSFCRITGYRPEEIVGKSHAVLRSGYHPREFYEDMWTTILAGKTWKGKIRNRGKEGHEYWVETSISAFTDDLGSPVQFMAVSHDITAKKEAEDSLYQTLKTIEFENKIWRVIDRVQTNLLVLKDERDMLLILLQIVCEDLGWDYGQIYQRECATLGAEKMVHQHSFSMNPAKLEGLIAAAKVRELQNGEDLPGLAWSRKAPCWLDSDEAKNKTVRPFNENGITFKSGLCVPLIVNEDLYGVVELLSVNQRPNDPMMSRAMVVIASYFGKVLERDIRERKEKDYREQLALSAKMSTLGEMASGIAHEINNPLSIVTGYAQTGLRHLNQSDIVDRQQIQRTFERIIATAHRIGKIVRGLRSFARDGSADEFVATSVRSIIEDSISICEVKIKEANIELRILPFDESLSVECRSVQISQIIINLLNNAADAIEQLQEKWIEVAVLEGENSVEIQVTDSGDGIPEALAQKIMQPFFTTKALGKGTGLGLSIARGIAQAHAGSFGIHQDKPHTTFYLRLPKKQPSSSGAGIERAG